MHRSSMALLLIVTLLGSACASSPASAPAAQPNAPAAPAAVPAAAAPKSLVVGILREPVSLITDVTGGNASGGGANQVQYIAHDFLTVQDEHGAWQPRLAAAPLSVEAGTWLVNPDGSMTTTWKLRPNVQWQDGTPFTADDLLFAYQVSKDPTIPNPSTQATTLMTSAEAPDPLTLVVHWSGTYIRANEALGLIPLPKHLLEATYQADKTAFTSSTRFTTDFVGLGAYRLTRWVAATEMDFTRFDSYFLGRPKVDTLIVRFLNDPNTLAANVLAGAVDVAPIGIDIDTAAELERRWAETGNQVVYFPRTNLRFIEIQYRPEYALPHNGLTNRQVREALYRVTDRPALNDLLEIGKGAVADSWVAPNDALRAQLAPVIPQYLMDQAMAQQLLDQAGWQRGADGVRVDPASGERLQIQLWTQESARAEKELNVIASGWESVGAKVDRLVIPPAQSGDREYRSTLPGAGTTGTFPNSIMTERYFSRSAPSAANRWVGNNRGGYNNPQADAIIDRLGVAVDDRVKATVEGDLLKLLIGDLALMPLIWEVDPVLMLTGVTGPTSNGSVSTWNVATWDRPAG